jgi:hypothetical protein
VIIEVLGVVAYEVVTTAVGVLGLKAISGDSLRKRMASLNQPKHLPVVDKFLKRELGHISKQEQWLAIKAAKAVNTASKYEAFKLILILLARKARTYENHSKGSRGTVGARRSIAGCLLAH